MGYEAGLRVWSVTCEGTATNVSTMNQLGVKLSGSYEEIKEWFNVPGVDEKVYTRINKF